MYKYIPEPIDPKFHEFVLEADSLRTKDVEDRFGAYILEKYGFNIEMPGFEYYYDPSLSAVGCVVGVVWNMIRNSIYNNQDLDSNVGYCMYAVGQINGPDFKRSITLYLRACGFSTLKYLKEDMSGTVGFVYKALKATQMTKPDTELLFKTQLLQLLGKNVPTEPNDPELEFKYPQSHFDAINFNNELKYIQDYFISSAPDYKNLEDIPGASFSNPGILEWFKQSGFPNSYTEIIGDPPIAVLKLKE